MRHGIVCGLAAALLCACQPGGGANAQPSGSAVPTSAQSASKQIPLSLHELSRIVGATCEDPQTGKGCVAGDYDVILKPGCGRNGLFAAVSDSDGALLIDKAPPDDTVRRANLVKGQLVCIEAIARAGTTASYYYVVAMPQPGKESCSTNGECMRYGNRHIEWLASRNGTSCRVDISGRFDIGCAAGWTDAEGLRVISIRP